MQNVAIATDTIACLTKEQIEHYEIGIVPLRIDFDGHVYREYLDISPSEAYQLIEKDPERFVTSAASPPEILEIFRKLSRRAQSILCITVFLQAQRSTQRNPAGGSASQTRASSHHDRALGLQERCRSRGVYRTGGSKGSSSGQEPH